ncbi:MAG: hypothetical protein JXQ27_11625 [Acidobacteria bacterium]|nr:hypothetical protein [Acidobacteriota bacterium]
MKKLLKDHWKTLALASGVGGLLFGGALFAYRKGYVGNPNPTVYLPEDMNSGVLRTSRYDMFSGASAHPYQAWCDYHLQRTRFRVWNILNKKEHPRSVYFVSPVQYFLDDQGSEETRRLDAFYAMVGIPRYFKKGDLLDHVRKDSPIVFYLCLVGGGPTGIPTGDKVLSRGKLESWEFHDGETLAEAKMTDQDSAG